jgi:hypothetical protein
VFLVQVHHLTLNLTRFGSFAFSFLYLSCKVRICGWIFCIFCMETCCFSRKGNSTRLIKAVSTMIDQPKFPI